MDVIGSSPVRSSTPVLGLLVLRLSQGDTLMSRESKGYIQQFLTQYEVTELFGTP